MDSRGESRNGRGMTGMTMMKKLMVVLALLLAAALLTACGNEKPQEPEQTVQHAVTDAPAVTEARSEKPASTSVPESGGPAGDAQSLSERVGAVAGDAAELVPFTPDELMDMTGIAPNDYTDFVFLQGDGMDGREILVVTAKDMAAGDRVEGQALAYLQRRRDENRNYAPAAYQLLSEAKVVRKGLTVVLISGADAAAETEQLLAGE